MVWSTRQLAELAGTTVKAVRLHLEVPLERVNVAGRADQHPDESLRALDADLAACIDRLEQVRADLPVTLRYRTPVGLPTASGAVTDDLSEVDRTMLMIYARVLDDSWLDHLRPVPPDDRRTDADDTFELLDPDADESTRRRVATAIATATRGQLLTHTEVSHVQRHASRQPGLAGSTVLAALREIYNPAQIDVLKRAYATSRHASGTGSEPITRNAPDA